MPAAQSCGHFSCFCAVESKLLLAVYDRMCYNKMNYADNS